MSTAGVACVSGRLWAYSIAVVKLSSSQAGFLEVADGVEVVILVAVVSQSAIRKFTGFEVQSELVLVALELSSLASVAVWQLAVQSICMFV